IEWETQLGLFEVNQNSPQPKLDTLDSNLYPPATPELQQVFERLQGKMDEILAAEPECRGDGNLDRVVDGRDLEEWGRIAREWGASSVYDFAIDGMFDGLTNHLDGDVIQANLGKPCAPAYAVY